MNLSEEPKTKGGTLSSERKRVQVERVRLPVTIRLIKKSDLSMHRLHNFRVKFTGDQRVQVERAGSPVPSSLSLKSDHSMGRQIEFRGELTGDQRVQVERAGSPVPSSLSLKSDHSMDQPIGFRGELTGDQRISFGLRGHNIGEAIKHLATLQGNQTALDQIREATTSCVHWGNILNELMQKDSITELFVRKYNKPMELCQIEKIGEELRVGKALIVSLKLPDGGQHAFCIEPRTGGRLARIIHAWQDIHPVRAENNMPIEEMIDYMKGLWSSDWVADRNKLQNIFEKLFGTDYAQFKSNVRPVRPRISFDMVFSGRPKLPLDEIGSRQRLSSLLSEISVWKSVGSSTAVGAALGFVFGLGGVLISGESDPTEVVLAETKSILGGAAGGAAGAVAAEVLTPTFSRIGTSVVRANVLSGVAFFSVFAIWDVVEWKVHKITEVQLRQRMAEGLAGAAGGIGVGAAAGVGFGLLFGPIGALIGGIIGGLAGGIGGAFAGKAIDGAIWDGNEDSVMNMYEFFGWHDVKRNTRPVKTAEEMEKAYDKKLESRPSKIKEEEWGKICVENVIVLLGAMYPVFTEVMKMADNLRKNRSDGVSAIGTAMYQSIPEE